MLPAKFFLCSIVGSDGESLCGNISQFVGPTLAPKGHVIELTTYFGALPCLGCGGAAAKSVHEKNCPRVEIAISNLVT